MTTPSTTTICLYAKPPVPGRTKSRLAASIGDDAAAQLARAMILDNCRLLTAFSDCSLQLWHPPDCVAEDFGDLIPSPFTFHSQHGADLGERMCNTFEQCLSESRRVIVLGCDCVTHTRDTIRAAIEALSTSAVVLHPAADGGYVLVGQSTLTRDIFEGIEWGTASVYTDTCDRLNAANMSWQALPETFDVDVISDLAPARQAISAATHPAVSAWFETNNAG